MFNAIKFFSARCLAGLVLLFLFAAAPGFSADIQTNDHDLMLAEDYSEAQELEDWRSARRLNTRESLQEYIDKYPNGLFERIAHSRMRKLGTQPPEPAPTEPATTAQPPAPVPAPAPAPPSPLDNTGLVGVWTGTIAGKDRYGGTSLRQEVNLAFQQSADQKITGSFGKSGGDTFWIDCSGASVRVNAISERSVNLAFQGASCRGRSTLSFNGREITGRMNIESPGNGTQKSTLFLERVE